jgi:hypothetical protein
MRLLLNTYKAPLFSIAIGVLMFLSFNQIRKSYWDRMVITSDGFGYYSYLPAIFIYGDLQYTFFEKVYHQHLPHAPVATFCNDINGKKANKYFAGEALLLTPFFLVAHVLSHLLGYPPDGYSDLYQLFLALGAVFYLALGCYFCFKLLELYTVPIEIIMFSIAVVVFGTNLFHYVAVEPSMSHVYSFAAIAGFIYFLKKYFGSQNKNDLFKTALCFAIILLIRPVNGIIIFSIPFLFGDGFSLKKTFQPIFQNKRAVITSIIIVATICSIQPLLYYAQCGKFVVWAYQGEGFNFLKPEILNILFSYKKGWFVYTPAAFIALLSFIYISRKSKFEGISLFAFLFLVIYILSCWWQWQYGMSFGLRAFIDYYPFLALMIGYTVMLFNSKVYKTIIVQLLLLALVINQIQGYQYRHFILHWDAMDKEKYWQVFLKTGKEYEGVLWK